MVRATSCARGLRLYPVGREQPREGFKCGFDTIRFSGPVYISSGDVGIEMGGTRGKRWWGPEQIQQPGVSLTGCHMTWDSSPGKWFILHLSGLSCLWVLSSNAHALSSQSHYFIVSSKAAVLRLGVHQNYLEGLRKHRFLGLTPPPPPQVPVVCLGISISDKCLGDAAAAGPKTTLWKPLS